MNRPDAKYAKKEEERGRGIEKLIGAITGHDLTGVRREHIWAVTLHGFAHSIMTFARSLN
ncbi:hypothetical protein QUB47_07290 [Microcoleus sp. AT9_B5]